ncbi:MULTISPECIES: hypothetical protein [Paraclostridium]|uniref:Uncharacterized protein n=1 Tax=Paraclostridium bifermentans TaxID=1490 RepID=A0AA44DPJ2_PARBF|nr:MULTISPECIES: hypothetical protein [Paraclostridium]MCU9807798.1 hypothetical protein [Paraclostridium sp. AKS46]EQK48867.1 hypothetical protein C671_0203 [[Clostridium] bifermentans ATCC 19299] [Paraclostridium bifermentans ATCC 19299]MBN8049488.1 hypothetical protein [Paraclostridium bifermentans]MBZ6007488.1 hypothetical protein [Paraclostridium bifermentans]MCE9677438.1 hypothetical protein [Paraclostridium bifermentans]
MSIDINEIKEELDQLCKDYVDIVSKMKNNKIINDDIYLNCVSNKIEFLEKNEMVKTK